MGPSTKCSRGMAGTLNHNVRVVEEIVRQLAISAVSHGHGNYSGRNVHVFGGCPLVTSHRLL